MIVTKLLGGLGNQMFQYAAARGVLKNCGIVYLDCGFLENNQISNNTFTARSYNLGIFKNLKAKKAVKWQFDIFISKSPFYKILRTYVIPSIRYLYYPDIDYKPLTWLEQYKYIYLNGYFQSENYFKSVRNEILNDFAFPELDESNTSIKNKIMAQTNSVSLHIRRGDYLSIGVNAGIHAILPLTYYYDAIDFINKKLKKTGLFIFSDDVDWVKDNLKISLENIQFVSNNNGADSWKDMALMSCCHHHIIANSSFSWWGAWLGQDINKIVVAPQNWFADQKMNEASKFIVPDNWIRF